MKLTLPVLIVFVMFLHLPAVAQQAENSNEPIRGGVMVNVDAQPLRLTRKGAAGSNSSNTVLPPPDLKAITPRYDSVINAQSFKSSASILKGGAQSARANLPASIHKAAPLPVRAPAVSGTPLTGVADSLANLARSFSTEASTTLLKPKSSAASLEPPYIWVQSTLGGYYDATQTTPAIVSADRLYQYGGKFADGTAVPRSQIGSLNSAGHAYRGKSLDTQSFWRR